MLNLNQTFAISSMPGVVKGSDLADCARKRGSIGKKEIPAMKNESRVFNIFFGFFEANLIVDKKYTV